MPISTPRPRHGIFGPVSCQIGMHWPGCRPLAQGLGDGLADRGRPEATAHLLTVFHHQSHLLPAMSPSIWKWEAAGFT